GWKALVRQLRDEAPSWARTLPQLPRLVHRVLADDPARRIESSLLRIEAAQHRQSRMLFAIALVLAVLVGAWLVS
ncbi:MAG TPA: ubiquinone biosynthesis regulatory protein kinase UbiB, partial [Usitatibacter sp.]|nr:ubiquinone biosynthesis regulatory protein kinase UbiB [Usitatibacter sp.]